MITFQAVCARCQTSSTRHSNRFEDALRCPTSVLSHTTNQLAHCSAFRQTLLRPSELVQQSLSVLMRKFEGRFVVGVQVNPNLQSSPEGI